MNKEELKELAATLNGIADGKAWEFQGLQENWYVGNLAGHNPQRLAADGWKIRLKPWSLPPPPEQQKVPLEPSDVLPFCVFRLKGFNDLLTPFCVKDERVYFFSDTSHCWGYEWLMRNAEINRSIPLTGKWNPEAWEPCYKLIDTP